MTVEVTDEKEIIEALAEIKHKLFCNMLQKKIDSGTIEASIVELWEKTFVPFAEMSEDLKEVDRKWAHELIEKFKL